MKRTTTELSSEKSPVTRQCPSDSVVDALRRIPPDAKIRCKGDKCVSFVSTIVCARCEPIRDLYEGIFGTSNLPRGSQDVILDFPTIDDIVVARYIAYLQFGDLPIEGSVQEWLDLYSLADRFNTKELAESITFQLSCIARNPSEMFEVYEKCTYPTLAFVRDISFAHIKGWFLVPPTHFACTKCSYQSNVHFCQICGYRFQPSDPEWLQCKCSKSLATHMLHFTYHLNTELGRSCNAPLKKWKGKIAHENIGDATMAEILHRLCDSC